MSLLRPSYEEGTKITSPNCNPDLIGPIKLPHEFTAARSESWHNFISRMRRKSILNPIKNDIYPRVYSDHWPKGKAHWCGSRPGKRWMDYAEYERRKNLYRSSLR